VPQRAVRAVLCAPGMNVVSTPRALSFSTSCCVVCLLAGPTLVGCWQKGLEPPLFQSANGEVGPSKDESAVPIYFGVNNFSARDCLLGTCLGGRLNVGADCDDPISGIRTLQRLAADNGCDAVEAVGFGAQSRARRRRTGWSGCFASAFCLVRTTPERAASICESGSFCRGWPTTP
jgi:hypothetical protein